MTNVSCLLVEEETHKSDSLSNAFKSIYVNLGRFTVFVF